MSDEPSPHPSHAVTKVRPPRLRKGAVARARLDRALARAIDEARVVVVVAPAGFGKTVALAFQVERLRRAGAVTAWVGLEDDDDLPRVAAALIAALEPADVPWRVSPEALVSALDDADAARRRRLADDIANALAATDVSRGAIVLDDAHRVQDARVFAFLNQLVERLPHDWCVVLASRTEPPAAVARWRASGDLAEFGQDDLRFDLDEVKALAGDGVDPLAALRPEALLARTRGWAAGLALALQARGSRAPLADRHVFDYVASEVLDQMPPAKRLFLVRCSVLPELSADRCALVSGDPDARRWLDEVERQGLFVSLRGEGADAVLVLHDLFRDCLDDILRREHHHDLVPLLQRAADSEPDVLRRIGYLGRAGAWDAVRELVYAQTPELITTGHVGAVLRALAQLPGAEGDRPEIDFARGYCAWAQWDFDAMRVAMRRAASGFARQGHSTRWRTAIAYEAAALIALDETRVALRLMEPVDDRDLEGDARLAVLHVRTWLVGEAGPLDAVARALDDEFDAVERRPQAASWYRAVPLLRHVGLPGLEHAMRRFVVGASATLPEQPSALRVLVLVFSAWIELAAGRSDAAAPFLEQAGDDARWLGQGTVLVTQIAFARAFWQLLRGEAEGALAEAEQLRASPSALPDGARRRFLEMLFDGVTLRLACALGRGAAASDAAERLLAQRPADDTLPFAAHVAALAGHAALVRGDAARADAAWRAAMREPERLRMHGLDLELGVRLAAADAARGDTAAAAAWLAPVLARGAEERVELFVRLAGRPALRGLADHAWGDALAASSVERLRRWAGAADAEAVEAGGAESRAARAPAARPPADPAPQGLTPREWEVLERLAAGDSNKVIARAFDLSPFTVKRHVANILDKLALASRGQAAAWFRAARPGA